MDGSGAVFFTVGATAGVCVCLSVHRMYLSVCLSVHL